MSLRDNKHLSHVQQTRSSGGRAVYSMAALKVLEIALGDGSLDAKMEEIRPYIDEIHRAGQFAGIELDGPGALKSLYESMGIDFDALGGDMQYGQSNQAARNDPQHPAKGSEEGFGYDEDTVNIGAMVRLEIRNTPLNYNDVMKRLKTDFEVSGYFMDGGVHTSTEGASAIRKRVQHYIASSEPGATHNKGGEGPPEDGGFRNARIEWTDEQIQDMKPLSHIINSISKLITVPFDYRGAMHYAMNSPEVKAITLPGRQGVGRIIHPSMKPRLKAILQAAGSLDIEAVPGNDGREYRLPVNDDGYVPFSYLMKIKIDPKQMPRVREGVKRDLIGDDGVKDLIKPSPKGGGFRVHKDNAAAVIESIERAYKRLKP